MINTTIVKTPAYTTRDFRNFGTHKANSLYDYKYTIQDLALLKSGAIKLFPQEMCVYIATKPAIFKGTKYDTNDIIDVKDFDKKTLIMLLKMSMLRQEFKPEFKNLDIKQLIKIAELNNCIGLSFKKVSDTFGLDFEKVKEVFELKQGANTKKVKAGDIKKLQELLEV